MDDEEWRGPQAASRCPFLNPDADLNTIINHNALFCDRCRDEQILEKTKGEEVLFPNSPPYWALPSGGSGTGNNGRKKTEEKEHTLPLLEFFKQIQSAQETKSANDGIVPQEENFQGLQETTSVYDMRECDDKGVVAVAGDGPSTSGVGVSSSTKQEPKRRKAHAPSRVPTGIALHNLTKQGFSKEEALLKYVENQRERAKPRADDDKVQIDREEMPWAPSYPKLLRKRRSVIQRPIDHQRYVAIVANFLNANHPQPRFQQNRQEVRVMDEKLADERMQFQQLVLQSISSRKKSIYTCEKNRAVSYILDRLRTRAASLQCHYGAPLYDEQMKELSVDALTVLTKKTTLHRGKMPKITLPNERRRFMFSRSLEDITMQFPPQEQTKYPIESDDLALHLAVKHGVRVVMCASSALKILSNPWVGDSPTYVIPVVVKCHFSERTNRFENVCLVGKPCVEKAINGPSSWRRYLKLSVKLALYGDLKKDRAAAATASKVSMKTGGRQRAKLREKMVQAAGNDGDEAKNNKGTPGVGVTDDADEEVNLIIADEDEEAKTTAAISDTTDRKEADNNHNIKTADTPPSAPIYGDILGDIMNEMGKTTDGDQSKDYRGLEHSGDLSAFSGADLSKRYTLFSLGHDGMQDVDVIIRGNNDGIDTTGSELAVVHKVEYAAEFGAEKLDDEEFLQDYFRCRLKCASQLVRFRIHSTEQHLLQKERYNENMLMANKLDLRKMAEERTQWLKKVIIRLESLQPGNYLIRKEAKRLQILPEAANSSEAYLKEDQLKLLRFDESLPSVKDVFRGIDEHLVLVYHIVQKRIPASFGPKKDGMPPSDHSGKKQDDGVPRGSAQAGRQSDGEIFGNPVSEHGRVVRDNAEGNQAFRRGKRSRPRGNFRRGARPHPGSKHPRFVDFDAPHGPQVL